MAYVPIEQNLQKKKIGVIPRQVKTEHLHPDGSLLTEAEISAIPTDVDNTRLTKDTEKVGRTQSGVPYSIIIENQKAYAVYGNGVVLGKGGYGKVKLAQDVKTKEWVALKVVDIKAKSLDQLQRQIGWLNTEAELLFRVTKRGAIVPDPVKSTKFHMIMKLESGDTADNLLQRDDLINVNGRFIIAHNMVKALNSLHDKGYVHRDIKGANIIVDPYTNQVGLIDLGMTDTFDNVMNDRSTMGTPSFMSPEVINAKTNKYSEKSDVYAMGVTLAEWFKLEVKVSSGLLSPVSAILESKKFREMVPDSKMRKEIMNLVHGMCERDVAKRLDGRQAEVALQKITDKLAFSNVKSNTVAILNVEEYMQANDGDKLFMREAMKKFDRVVLVYPAGNQAVSAVDVSIVHQQLSAAGLKCATDAYTYTEATKNNVFTKLESAVRAEYRSHMQLMHVTQNSSLYTGNFLGAENSQTLIVTPDKTSDEYKRAMENSVVNNVNLGHIKEELQKELLRVKSKYGDSPELAGREKKIKEFITLIDKHAGPIKYKELAEQLKKLAQELQKVNPPNQFMRFFKGPTQTEKLVERMHSSMTPKNKS